MKSLQNIEKSIRALHDSTSADMDKRVLEDAWSAYGRGEVGVAPSLRKWKPVMITGLLVIIALIGFGFAQMIFKQRCADNLKQLGLALQMYAHDHNGEFPDEIAILHPLYISHLRILKCPRQRRGRASYVYVGGLTVEDEPNAIVAYDASAVNHDGKGTNVLFVSGYVRYYAEDAFRALLESFLNEYGDRVNLTRVVLPASVEKIIAQFDKIYVLSRREDLKYIDPPLRTGEQPCCAYYRWSEDQGLTRLAELHSIHGANNLVGVLKHVAGVYSNEVEGDQKLRNDYRIPGDFIVRTGTPMTTVVERLGEILRREIGLPVRLVFRDVERKVIVARGIFHHTPIPEYPCPGCLHGEKPPLVPRTGHPDYHNHPACRIAVYGEKLTDSGGGGGGDLQEFLEKLGNYIGRWVVNEVDSPPEGRLQWRYHRGEDSGDIKLVLQHLTEQTGLTFNEEERLVRVLFIERID